MNPKSLRIGFVSTRLEGTDGVSLEAFKWAHVLEEQGHRCFYYAGVCDRPDDVSRVVPEAHFDHPDIRRINQDLFDDYVRSPATSEMVHDLWRTLKRSLNDFLDDFDLDLLVVENALSIPMNVPLGLALTDLIAESDMPTIGHHHDFAWERTRFAVHAAADYLQAAFPPRMPSIHNVVINSYAATELARRTGMRSTTIPNVMDFDNGPPAPDDFSATLRAALDIAPGDFLLLQPTRVVPRKRIERAVELACRLDLPATIVVSHSWGDEGLDYKEYLADLASRLGVRILFAADRFNHDRGKTAEGEDVYSLGDAYQQSDLVTYPSSLEGFGNAFLEAIYYRRPLVMSTYEIYRMDIKPKGFQLIEFADFMTRRTIASCREVLADPSRAGAMADHNYALARRHYSYRILRRRLELLLDHLLGILY